MSPTQIAIFTSAAGESPDALRLGVATMVLTLALFFVAWTTFTALTAWRSGVLDLHGAVWLAVRGAIVLTLLSTFIR